MRPRTTSGLLLLCCLLHATPARAQDSQPAQPPASQPLTEQEARRQAKESFRRAETSYRLGRFAEALAGYETTLKLRRHPNIIFNIAQCHRQLKNAARAVFFYKLFLDDWERVNPGTRPPNEAEVKAHVATLEAELRTAARARPAWGQLPPSGGELVLKGVPGGAQVFVDGALRGQGPMLAPISLPVGRRLVRIVRPGHQPWSQSVTIALAKRATVEVRLLKLVNVAIDSSPAGAAVVVDGTERGWTPLRLTLTAERPHTVVLRKQGCEQQTQTLTLKPQDSARASYSMLPTRDRFGSRNEHFAIESGLAFAMGGRQGFVAGEVAIELDTLKWKHVSWTVFSMGGGYGSGRFYAHMESRLGYPFRFGRIGQHQVRLALGFGALAVSKDELTRTRQEVAWIKQSGINDDRPDGGGPFVTLCLSPSVEYLYQTRGRTLIGGGFRALVPITRNMAHDSGEDLDGCPAVGLLTVRVGWASLL